MATTDRPAASGRRRRRRRPVRRRRTTSSWRASPSAAGSTSSPWTTRSARRGRAGQARRARRPGARRARHRADRPGADRHHHPHRAVPRLVRRGHPGLGEPRPGGLDRRGVGHRGRGAARSAAAPPLPPPNSGRRRARSPTSSARLWDSWEDDAEIRDTATGRFVDRDKLHYVDFEGAAFRVRGPAIVPRPPQGHPVVAVAATDPATWDTAARHADVVYVRATDAGAAGRIRDELRRRAAAYGRDPGALTVLAPLAVDLGDGEGAASRVQGRPPRPAAARSADRPGRRPAAVPRRTGRPRGPDRRMARRRCRGRLPHHPRRPAPRPGALRQRHGRAAPAPRAVPHLLSRYDAPRRTWGGRARPTATPARGRQPDERPTAAPADPSRRALPRRQQHDGVELTRASGSQIDFSSFDHLARTAERGLFDFFFLAEGLRLREHGGRVHDLDVRGQARVAHRAERARRRHRPAGPGRHRQRDLQRAVRTRPPPRLPRPPQRGPRRLERRHLLRRVHRRELPARRLPRPRRPLHPGRRVRRHRARAVGLLAGGRCAAPVRAPGRAVRHRGAVRRTALPAGASGGDPGRGLRRGPGVRRLRRRHHLHPARRPGGGPRLLRRRQAAAGGVRPGARAI